MSLQVINAQYGAPCEGEEGRDVVSRVVEEWATGVGSTGNAGWVVWIDGSESSGVGWGWLGVIVGSGRVGWA